MFDWTVLLRYLFRIRRADTRYCGVLLVRYDPEKHQRRSIRLREYDYRQAGAYFVTICTRNRECFFGEIVNGEMQLNDTGRIVKSVWAELPGYEGVSVDEFVVMPNHVHGIIVLGVVGATPCGCPSPRQARSASRQAWSASGQAQGPAPTMSLSLPDVVHRFKSLSTARYRQRGFGGALWQRNYYEHVIRGGGELFRIRRYIEGNPKMWDIDRENPAAHRV